MTKKQSARDEFKIHFKDALRYLNKNKFAFTSYDEEYFFLKDLSRELWNWIENHVEEERKKARTELADSLKGTIDPYADSKIDEKLKTLNK